MTKKKILIVDDHQEFREMLRLFIERIFTDVEIQEAATGEQGVEMAIRNRPIAGLIDVQLPGINGIEVVQQIKSQLPDCRIIIMSMFKQSSIDHLMNKETIDFINKAEIESMLVPLLHKFLNGYAKKGGKK